jgi:hypothetical protein
MPIGTLAVAFQISYGIGLHGILNSKAVAAIAIVISVLSAWLT